MAAGISTPEVLWKWRMVTRFYMSVKKINQLSGATPWMSVLSRILSIHELSSLLSHSMGSYSHAALKFSEFIKFLIQTCSKINWTFQGFTNCSDQSDRLVCSNRSYLVNLDIPVRELLGDSGCPPFGQKLSSPTLFTWQVHKQFTNSTCNIIGASNVIKRHFMWTW